MDNCARGRLKHVWFSISPDLRGVAEGDLDNLGCGLVVIDGCNALGKASTPEHGVLFSTYTTPAGSTSQLEKIIAWCGDGFDGCLVFDEAHCAKNADPNNPEKSSGVNRAVMALQERLPMARVVYSSATGVTELTDLQYATRLTLWGPGTSFNGFEDFYKVRYSDVHANPRAYIRLCPRAHAAHSTPTHAVSLPSSWSPVASLAWSFSPWR